jgi:hypothetical protein
VLLHITAVLLADSLPPQLQVRASAPLAREHVAPAHMQLVLVGSWTMWPRTTATTACCALASDSVKSLGFLHTKIPTIL